MKHKFLLLFLLYSFCFFAQNEVYVFKDINKEYTIENITSADFRKIEGTLKDKYSDAYYWFKIPKTTKHLDYIFSLNSVYIKEVFAYKNGQPFNGLMNQRFKAFRFNGADDVYIRVAPFLKWYIPFRLSKESDYYLNENLAISFNGFYYGFSLLVILYSFVYYFSFKDDTYLYYALLLVAIVLGFFIIDGTYNFFKINQSFVNTVNALNYVLLSYFSAKFVDSFLFLKKPFPKLRKCAYALGSLIVMVSLAFIFTGFHYFYIALGILTTILFFIFWVVGIVLFRKNLYIKILVIGFALLLFSVFDSFIMTNLGSGILKNNNTTMKVGGFIQIIVLWFAVIGRERVLRQENDIMKKEIVSFSEKLDTNPLNVEDAIRTLSKREKEIFDLITVGKSNKEISNELHISINTVKFHIKNIYEKLNIKSRKEVYNFTSS